MEDEKRRQAPHLDLGCGIEEHDEDECSATVLGANKSVDGWSAGWTLYEYRLGGGQGIARGRQREVAWYGIRGYLRG